MRIPMTAVAAAMLLSLTACGGKGDDKLGDQAEHAMDNKADAMDAQAHNMSGAQADMMHANAQATRDAGEAKEDAIDDADVNTQALSNEQKSAIVNGQ